MTERVGFIGLGAMGLGMAGNLAKAGHEVFAYDPSPERQALAKEMNIVMVDSPCTAAASSDSTVFSVVRTKEQTDDVLLGETGVLQAGVPRTIVVSSTLDPTMVRALAKRVADEGSALVDATLSGGTWGAQAGTLTLMVSGHAQDLDRTRHLLEAVSSRLYVVGDEPGVGQAVKLAVQLSFCIHMMAAYEALQTVASHGVDEQQLMDILSHSVGSSWTTQNWERVTPWWKHHRAGGDLEIQLKDLRSALAEADRDSVAMPVSAVTFQMLREVWSSRG